MDATIARNLKKNQIKIHVYKKRILLSEMN